MENEVKEPAPKYNYISPEAYLAAERVSENRSEYYDGHIIAMAGASLKHNKIAMNLYREVGSSTIQTIGFTLTLQEIYDGTDI